MQNGVSYKRTIFPSLAMLFTWNLSRACSPWNTINMLFVKTTVYSSRQIFLCFKFTKQKFFLTRNLVCLNFLEMLIFTLSSFVYFCLVCFFEGEGWFRGWIEGIYMLAHLLCINFFHRTIWIFKDPSFSPPPSPHPLPLPLPATHTHTHQHTHTHTHTHSRTHSATTSFKASLFT